MVGKFPFNGLLNLPRAVLVACLITMMMKYFDQYTIDQVLKFIDLAFWQGVFGK